MDSDVPFVGLRDDLEAGAVTWQMSVTGSWADLSSRDLWGPPLEKPFLKCPLIPKSDGGTWTSSRREDGSRASARSPCRSCGSRIESFSLGPGSPTSGTVTEWEVATDPGHFRLLGTCFFLSASGHSCVSSECQSSSSVILASPSSFSTPSGAPLAPVAGPASPVPEGMWCVHSCRWTRELPTARGTVL